MYIKIYLLNICLKVLNRIFIYIWEKFFWNSFKVLKVSVNIVSLRLLVINYVLEERLKEKL